MSKSNVTTAVEDFLKNPGPIGPIEETEAKLYTYKGEDKDLIPLKPLKHLVTEGKERIKKDSCLFRLCSNPNIVDPRKKNVS